MAGRWRSWSGRPDGWWYFLPMTAYMVLLAVQEGGINRIISVVLAVFGVVFVLRDLFVPREDATSEEADNRTTDQRARDERHPDLRPPGL